MQKNQKTRSLSYQKQKVEQNTASKIKQGFFNVSTNISYRLTGGLQKFRDLVRMDSNKRNKDICIHGRRFGSEQEAQGYVSKILWFSYRMIPGLSSEMHSDTGWGCLIRVGQMALAAGLRAYFQTISGTGSVSQKDKTLIAQNVIVAFVEKGGKSQKYSLKKIVQHAKSKYKLDYGKWFNKSQICQVLSYLHEKDPMKGAQNLIIVNFKDCVLYLDKIFEKMNKNMCNCKKRRIQCLKCNSSQQRPKQQQIHSLHTDINISTSLHTKKQPHPHPHPQPQLSKSLTTTSTLKKLSAQKRLLLFLGCRMGNEKIGQEEYKQLLELLSLECSLGIIGGIPRKGFYFTGYYGEQLVYLDPHLVQDEVTLDKLHLLRRTFESKEMRKVGRQDIDPSMAFVFFIDSLQTLSKLYNKIQSIKDNYNNSMFSVEWVEQKYGKSGISNVEELDQQQENQCQNSFIEEL